MILPVTIIGSPILRKVAVDIDKNYEGLDTIVKDLWDTMYASDGVGLAAPQIDKSIRIFVIDGTALKEDDSTLVNFKKVFYNARITERSGEEYYFNEGCISVPNFRDDIKRQPKIRMNYYDEKWEFRDEVFAGVRARIIQHEYDHLEGILFTDHISPLKKRLMKAKLDAISKGKFKVNYRVKVFNRKY